MSTYHTTERPRGTRGHVTTSGGTPYRPAVLVPQSSGPAQVWVPVFGGGGWNRILGVRTAATFVPER